MGRSSNTLAVNIQILVLPLSPHTYIFRSHKL